MAEIVENLWRPRKSKITPKPEERLIPVKKGGSNIAGSAKQRGEARPVERVTVVPRSQRGSPEAV